MPCTHKFLHCMHEISSSSAKLCRLGMGGDGMGWDGMGWDGMGWDGMGWDGMGWDGGWDGKGLDRIGWVDQIALRSSEETK